MRPVSSACLVGEHNAVAWHRLTFNPLAAKRAAVGRSTGPTNALEAANPTSSSNMSSTFGAPAGGDALAGAAGTTSPDPWRRRSPTRCAGDRQALPAGAVS